jgi:hypothetical protein
MRSRLQLRIETRDTLRAAAALLLVSVWMALLMTGGWPVAVVHVSLAAALAVFPWRRLRGGEAPSPTSSSSGSGSR